MQKLNCWSDPSSTSIWQASATIKMNYASKFFRPKPEFEPIYIPIRTICCCPRPSLGYLITHRYLVWATKPVHLRPHEESSKEQLWDRFPRGDTVSARFFIDHILKHRRVLKNDFPPFTTAAYDAVFEASVDSLSICLTENICTATQCLFLKVKLSFCLWLHLPYIHLKHLKNSASLTCEVNHSSKL